MKILMVTMSMNIGGAETHILELCRELISRGESVTLASFGGVYADEAVRFGVRHVTLPLNTKKPAAVMKAYRGLRKLILEERFDVVHAHARIPAFICGLLHDHLRLDGYKFRFVTTAHLDFSTNALWRRISRWGERVMVVSDDIADYMETEYAYPRERIYKTINGIDTAKFSPETDFGGILRKLELDSSRRRIVYMSRLDSDRADAAFVLIRIAPRIAELYPDCDIVIVGGGDRLDEARALADETNRAIGREIIKIAGAVSNTNEYCAAADVFIGVSRSALEAMSAARPVIIAGNQGSLGVFDETKIAPAVATNFCCRGYDCATEDSLFADLSRILDMTDGERAKMGEYNRAFIEKYYTTRRMADDYARMYEETLASPALYFGAPDVVISGYYGFGNLGDESLLDAISCSLAESRDQDRGTYTKPASRLEADRAQMHLALQYGGGVLPTLSCEASHLGRRKSPAGHDEQAKPPLLRGSYAYGEERRGERVRLCKRHRSDRARVEQKAHRKGRIESGCCFRARCRLCGGAHLARRARRENQAERGPRVHDEARISGET